MLFCHMTTVYMRYNWVMIVAYLSTECRYWLEGSGSGTTFCRKHVAMTSLTPLRPLPEKASRGPRLHVHWHQPQLLCTAHCLTSTQRKSHKTTSQLCMGQWQKTIANNYRVLKPYTQETSRWGRDIVPFCPLHCSATWSPVFTPIKATAGLCMCGWLPASKTR